ncbi:hypothetical protein J1N35_002285 [Gossypium stocksii]|uniref:Uncharacterized protein n=1 Tax=Gossypium stocksii TaxID=47602 RepID=A0A9D4AM93_9ROSI|nr:hypothetical protein J1N35_002285 [Gossypium stocksii]
MDWPRYWSHYIEMWENQYDYIPTREPIIVLELACVPEYMLWFRIHDKHIYCRQRRGGEKFVLKGNDEAL